MNATAGKKVANIVSSIYPQYQKTLKQLTSNKLVRVGRKKTKNLFENKMNLKNLAL